MTFVENLSHFGFPLAHTLVTQVETALLNALKEENELDKFLLTIGETALMAWLRIVHAEKDGRCREDLTYTG